MKLRQTRFVLIPALPVAFALVCSADPGTGPVIEVYGGWVRGAMIGTRGAVYGSPADQWNTDTAYRCATVAQLLWHATAGNPAFQYEFVRTPVGRQAVGATHATELSYVFGTFDDGIWGIGPPARATAIDREISDAMQQYWTNFAKTGNPNRTDLPEWPRFNAASRGYIQFTDSRPIARQGLRRPYCNLFIERVAQLMNRKPTR